tara:strand:+ start:8085 stop:8549 length:465 start_codon:yes stop_codon:yes gene_type:complete
MVKVKITIDKVVDKTTFNPNFLKPALRRVGVEESYVFAMYRIDEDAERYMDLGLFYVRLEGVGQEDYVNRRDPPQGGEAGLIVYQRGGYELPVVNDILYGHRGDPDMSIIVPNRDFAVKLDDVVKREVRRNQDIELERVNYLRAGDILRGLKPW